MFNLIDLTNLFNKTQRNKALNPDTMGTPSFSNDVFSIISFIFCFLQKSVLANFTLFLSQTNLFFRGWFGLLSFKNLPSASSDVTLDQSGTIKHVYIPLLSETDPEEIDNHEETYDQNEEDNTKISIRESIAEKSQATLWLKIKEIADSQGNSEATLSETSLIQEKNLPEENFIKNDETRKVYGRNKIFEKSFLPGTMVKLEEYNVKTRDYLRALYSDRPDVDRIDFTNPFAISNFSRSFLVRRKNSSRRSPKKQSLSFRPTKLSTVLETLAY